MYNNETKFTPAYIQVTPGSKWAKAGIASYASGAAVLLYFSASTFGAPDGSLAELKKTGVSMHQFVNSRVLPSADVAGVRALFPSAVVALEGSTEYETARNESFTPRPGSGSGAATPAPAPAPAEPEQKDIDLTAVLTAALESVAGPMGKMMASGVAPSVNAAVAALLDDAVKNAAPGLKTKQTDKAKFIASLPDGSSREINGVEHDMFKTCLVRAFNRRWVYLAGPAGSGKSTLATQIAQALGLPCFIESRIIEQFALSGFVDAHGKFVETAFYKAWTTGGVYLGDELDAWDAQALTWLNNALDARVASFPNSPDIVKCHPDFVFVGAGNTNGRGASLEYTGRNTIDAATLGRFGFVTCDYSRNISLLVAGACGADLVDFVDEIRKVCKENGVLLIAGTREIKHMSQAVSWGETEKQAIEIELLKGLDIDQVNIISANLKGSGVWYDALKQIAKGK